MQTSLAKFTSSSRQNLGDHSTRVVLVAQISLTCKEWQRLEREHPHCPEHLQLRSGNFNASYMAWHFRDTSRLREVTLLGLKPLESGDSYWELMPKVLLHLSVSALTLRSLVLIGTPSDPCNMLRGVTLPLIGALRQLESLVLRWWRYSAADFPAITHITSLQNLKEVELSHVVHDNEGVCKWKDREIFVNGAAWQFKETILALWLTRLELVAADIMSDEYDPKLLSDHNFGNLGKLRSFTYQHDMSRLPFISGLSKLTYLQLHVWENEEDWPDMLTNLCKLQELSINMEHIALQPLVISNAAEVTRLAIEGDLDRDDLMSDVLPLETLRNVKDLTVRLRYPGLEPEWPDYWNQLTSISRLELECLNRLDYNLYALPDFRIKSLIDVGVAVQFEFFDSSGEEYLSSLIGCLPALSRLQIAIWGLIYFGETGSDARKYNSHSIVKKGLERLKAVCMAVQSRTSSQSRFRL